MQIDAWAVQEKMDFLKYGGKVEKPVYRVMDLYTTDLINEKNVPDHNFFLRRNIINTMDDYFTLGQSTYEGEYYSVGKFVNRPKLRNLGGSTLLYKSNIWLHNEQYKMTR